MDSRVKFDFEISFTNGGGISGNDFRLDIHGDDITDEALAEYLVADLRLLMVSRVRYTSFKGSGTGPKADRVPFVALVVAVGLLIAMWVDPPKTLLGAALIYAASGPVLWLMRRRGGAAGATS